MTAVVSTFTTMAADSKTGAEPSAIYEMRVYYAAEGKLDAPRTPASVTTP